MRQRVNMKLLTYTMGCLTTILYFYITTQYYIDQCTKHRVLRQESQRYIQHVMSEQWDAFRSFQVSCLVISLAPPHRVLVDTEQLSFGEDIELSHNASEILHVSEKIHKPTILALPDLDGTDDILCILRRDVNEYAFITYMAVH